MGRCWRVAIAVLAAACALALGGCGKTPVLLELEVARGPEQTLVMVKGKHLAFAALIWDAGLPTERELPAGFLGPYMFSVPPGADLGSHPVALKRGSKRSNTLNFKVTPRQKHGPPRIDAVTIVAASFHSDGYVTTVLYVQGANLDVGAVVQVDGAEVATVAHKGMRNDLLGILPRDLAYPIYHYLAVVALPDRKPVGSTVTLKVKNLDGRTSDAFSYALPADAASLDSDGDDIPDIWETAGYDADGDGVIDVNLHALGAHPHRRDIFLEIDVMTGGSAVPPIPTTTEGLGTFDTVRAMFASAPILNPYGNSGINLVIDSSGTIPYVKTLGFWLADSTAAETANFVTLKNAHFDNKNRGRIFHYAIWAYAHENGASGHSDIKFDDTGVLGPGDDLFISLGDFGPDYETVRTQAETLAHELGHDLGQRHGGNDSLWHKPNYWSVMNYSWQMRTSNGSEWRKKKLTCFPIYYGVRDATEIDGALPAVDKLTIDYSQGMAAPLDEHSLDESKGACGQALDWNLDGIKTGSGISADINRNGAIDDKYTDFANWRALDFSGPRQNGSVLSAGD